MRSLEIQTERIFNNLIKQNQKLAADFILKQSKIVSNVQSSTSSVNSPESSTLSPAFSVQSSVSIVQLPEFSVQGSDSSIQSPTSRVQHPESSVQSPASRVQSPASRVQHPESSFQGLSSRVHRPESIVQSPASRVKRPTLASRVQEFRYALNNFYSLYVYFLKNILHKKIHENLRCFLVKMIFLRISESYKFKLKGDRFQISYLREFQVQLMT